MNHLDYIQGMGFDAVWISPVSANLEGATSQGEAFHGYVCLSSRHGLYRLIFITDTGRKIWTL
jgi:hypothetical protein